MSHPDLFAGFNTSPNNFDEVNGQGINALPAGTHGGTGVSPIWTSTFKSMPIVLITSQMMSIFVTECPDLIIRGGPDTVVFPAEVETLVMREAA